MIEAKLLSRAATIAAQLRQLVADLKQLSQASPDKLEYHDALIHAGLACGPLVSCQDELARAAGVELDDLVANLEQCPSAIDHAGEQSEQLQAVVAWATLWPMAEQLAGNAGIDPTELQVAGQVTERLLSYACCILGVGSPGEQVEIARSAMRNMAS